MKFFIHMYIQLTLSKHVNIPPTFHYISLEIKKRLDNLEQIIFRVNIPSTNHAREEHPAKAETTQFVDQR